MPQRFYLIFVILALALLGFVYFRYTYPRLSESVYDLVKCNRSEKSKQEINRVLQGAEGKSKQEINRVLQGAEGLKYNQPDVRNSRTDVTTLTPWLAPIVWEGTFDLSVVNGLYSRKNITVAATVFALGKYVCFLKDFLQTAEQHFMVGYSVHYYLFTDRPEEVPTVTLGEGRQLTKIKSSSSSRWQEITLRRMEMIEKLIDEGLINEVDFIFSLDVDTKFYGHWGAESFGDLVAALHPGYFGAKRSGFPYERRSKSTAFIPLEEGDYYYGGAVIGGRVGHVYQLVKTCRTQLDVDRANQIEAAWQEESHLNKYLLYNKPSKVLSPEYLWQDFKQKTSNMKVIRFSQVIKNYAEVRPNP